MKKFLGKVKGLAVAGLVAVGGGLSAMAEGTGNTIDTTVASTALSDMVDAVKGYINTCIPYIVSLLGVALVVTLVWVAWKWIKKGSSKAS